MHEIFEQRRRRRQRRVHTGRARRRPARVGVARREWIGGLPGFDHPVYAQVTVFVRRDEWRRRRRRGWGRLRWRIACRKGVRKRLVQRPHGFGAFVYRPWNCSVKPAHSLRQPVLRGCEMRARDSLAIADTALRARAGANTHPGHAPLARRLRQRGATSTRCCAGAPQRGAPMKSVLPIGTPASRRIA